MQKNVRGEELDIDDQIRPSSLIDHTLPLVIKCSVVVYCYFFYIYINNNSALMVKDYKKKLLVTQVINLVNITHAKAHCEVFLT